MTEELKEQSRDERTGKIGLLMTGVSVIISSHRMMAATVTYETIVLPPASETVPNTKEEKQ